MPEEYRKFKRTVNSFLFLAIANLWLFVGCGGGGQGSSSGGGGTTNVIGSLKASNGSLTDNAAWAVVFVERDTGICRVGEVSLGGKYSIFGLPVGRPQTVVALNPSFVFQSVLSHVDSQTVKGTLRQYFTMSGSSVPSLVESGQILRFADASALSFQPNAVVDADGLGTPDGMETLSPLGLTSSTLIDTDGDKIPNELDSDIDGDGIANWFDVDMDGNLIQNIFDYDGNGNEVLDTQESNSEQHFKEGVEFFAPQVIQVIESTVVKTSIFFTTKVRETDAPSSVTIRGSTNLFTGAIVSSVDTTTGAESSTAWNGSLSDDGVSGDGELGDRTYAKKITLAQGVIPKPGQVVFLTLKYGELETSPVKEYPFIFPEVNPGTISGSAVGRTVSIAGIPFVNSRSITEAIATYNWSVLVYDTDGYKVYSSDSFTADLTSYEIPSGVISAGTYTANVIVQSEGRISGMPNWTIKSDDFTMTIAN